MFPTSVSSPVTPRVGLEPTTLRLTAGCSTIELSRKFVPLRGTKQDFRSAKTCSGLAKPLQASQTLKIAHIQVIPCVSCRSFFSSPSAFSFHFVACLLLDQALDLLVPVSCTHFCASTSGLLPCRLQGVLLLADGISLLEGGFTLRCLQRLSLPDLATRPWDGFPTDTPAVRPFRSSRTKNSSSQISYAHDG